MTVFSRNFSLEFPLGSLSVTEELLQESSGQRAAIFSICKKCNHLVKKFYVYSFYCIILASYVFLFFLYKSRNGTCASVHPRKSNAVAMVVFQFSFLPVLAHCPFPTQAHHLQFSQFS